ncbi:MAG TPA: hypothetical protein VGM33_22875 [Baekduia sp.]
MRCLVYRERGTGPVLVRVGCVEVPDDDPTPEATAWTAWARGGERPAANYSVVRAGQRFEVTSTEQRVLG